MMMTKMNQWMAVMGGAVALASAGLLAAGCDQEKDGPYNQEDMQLNERENSAAEEAKSNENQVAEHGTSGMHEANDQKEMEAEADLKAGEGTKIDGEARFTDDGDGVKIVVHVKDAPVGEKGIHIHEKGDCSDIAADSMGGHFAPQGDKHGLPSQPQDQIHLGDLGNIEIEDDGTGSKEITVKMANLKEGDKMSLLGKALVIHQAKDKGASNQPSGGSGKPIACGVIEKS